MDIVMSGETDGIHAATRLHAETEIPVVFVTSHTDERTLLRARETAPFGYVLKPFEPRALQATIEIALHRAHSEYSLRRVERWLATTLRSIADAVIATDRNGRITFLNPAAERLIGWRQGDALGRAFSEVFEARFEATGQPLADLPRQVLEQGDTQVLSDTILLRSQAGTEAYIEQTVSPVRNDHGQISGTVVVFRDCSIRKQAEKETRRAQEELRRSNDLLLRKHEELQSFYHTVSHEIKTPLTAAREFVSLVLEGLAGPVTDTGKEYLGIAQESCDQMRVCLNDLLDSTRLDTGKMSLEAKPALLDALTESVAAMLAPAVAAKHLQLETRVEPDLPEIFMDEHRIAQVLTNLLNNAIKFTPEGGRITVSVGRCTTEGDYLKVRVSDSGCGIPGEHLERIFDRLYQVRGEDVSKGKGLGLGLHICQELVRLHGGRIWAESGVGKGSEFSFLLPFLGVDRRRVLVVDDEPAFRELVRQILERAGYEVALAGHGKEAMDRMAERPAELAILDLFMPEMDGPATLERLRAIRPSLPVIIHTGYPDGDLMARALDHSPVTLLVKPCDPSRFLTTVSQVLASANAAA
jgi:two-component system, cell cycle sensor histidine kinase and response regulator CckA